ncbi:hypothetical protein YC2023_122784 [Brassica napus]
MRGWPEKMSDDELKIMRNAGVVLQSQREITVSINIQVAKFWLGTFGLDLPFKCPSLFSGKLYKDEYFPKTPMSCERRIRNGFKASIERGDSGHVDMVDAIKGLEKLGLKDADSQMTHYHCHIFS